MFSIATYLPEYTTIIISRYQCGVNLTAYKNEIKWYDNSESEVSLWLL